MIFVVDDERLIRDTLRLILADADYAVEAFACGVAALSAAQTCPPHLLLTDIAMPGMGGIELASHMLALCPECHIIFMSGHHRPDEKVSAPLANCLFLAKPFHPTTLLEEVRIRYLSHVD